MRENSFNARKWNVCSEEKHGINGLKMNIKALCLLTKEIPCLTDNEGCFSRDLGLTLELNLKCIWTEVLFCGWVWPLTCRDKNFHRQERIISLASCETSSARMALNITEEEWMLGSLKTRRESMIAWSNKKMTSATFHIPSSSLV